MAPILLSYAMDSGRGHTGKRPSWFEASIAGTQEVKKACQNTINARLLKQDAAKSWDLTKIMLEQIATL
jgi:hypothetical protein